MSESSMADPTSMPPPRTVEEVVQLVKQLYNPEYASLVPQINQQLMQLQSSEDAWTLADQLMGVGDTDVRFYAALTFTVKLNNDGPRLDEEKATAVLARLISWLVLCVNEREKPLVCKKLCTALNTYFIQSAIFWHRPLLHVALSFQQGTAITLHAVEECQTSMPVILSSLSNVQQRALLWLADILAEEVGKLPAKAQKYAAHHSEMKSTVKDASAIMQTAFEPPAAPEVRSEALQTYVTLIHYTQYVWSNNEDAVQPLHDLFELASACLIDEAVQDDALDHFRDIIDSYPAFFRSQDMETFAIFIRDHIRPNLFPPVADPDSDTLPMVQFIVAFGCGNISQIVQEPQNELMSGVVVQILLDIIANDGIPGDDDQLAIHTIEFWNTYIEYANDVVYSDGPNPPWRLDVEPVLKMAVELFWKKLWIPTRDKSQFWGSSEQENFKEFRIDTTDLIESIFILLGEEMLQQLVSLMLHSLESKAWRALEASLYCLNKCADTALEKDWSEEHIGAIFRSNLFVQVANYQDVPTTTCKTAIETIGSYGAYIERHAEFLPDTIRFLWACLESAPLVNMAAKNIDKLCSICRYSLTNELPGFLSQYESLVASQSNEPFAKQKIIGAIAAIIQALKPESDKAAPLMVLLDNIERDVQRAISYGDAGDIETAHSIGISAMECLACVGRGMQVPDDVPIDIYDDGDEVGGDEVSFWHTTSGQAVQQKIMGCFSVLRVVGNQSDAVDAACQTLRSGINESEPGPFVLSPSFSVHFLQQCNAATPALPSVLSIIRTLLMTQSGSGPKLTDNDVIGIYMTVAGFMETLGQSTNDPTIASECIDTLTRFLPGRANIFFAQIGSGVLDFTLTAMNGLETPPKRSACDLWTKIIAPKTRAMTEETQTRFNQLMIAYGPKFVESLVRQLSGQALRSDLDYLCEPLKALLLHHPGTKVWLQQALVSEAFSASHITVEQRYLYLRQILAAGSDGRKVKELTKEFWANCRNTVVSYTS